MSTEIDILFNNVKRLNELQSVNKEEFNKVIDMWEMLYMSVIITESKNIQSTVEQHKENEKG